MANLATLDTLHRLQQEMAAEGRTTEEEALRDAVAFLGKALTKADDGLLTTGDAAERLGVSISTVKRWVERGVLKGMNVGTRWLVARESVERIVRIRKTLAEMDAEGNPPPEEFEQLRRRGRHYDAYGDYTVLSSGKGSTGGGEHEQGDQPPAERRSGRET